MFECGSAGKNLRKVDSLKVRRIKKLDKDTLDVSEVRDLSHPQSVISVATVGPTSVACFQSTSVRGSRRVSVNRSLPPTLHLAGPTQSN